MRTRVWCTSLVLASLAVGCGDQPTEVVPERQMTQGPGIIALATSSSDDGLSITTDKDDYQPGDTVWFIGAGWPANDTLDILLEDEPATHEPHTWWVPTGEDGTFRDSTYVVDIGDIDVTFTLTTTSRATGRSLTVQFTDGQPQAVTLSPTSFTVSPGGAASYTASVNMVGNTSSCTINLEVTTALPGGASASFNDNPHTVDPGNGDFSRALTIATTAATPPGNYPFTVRASRGDGCQGMGAGPTTTGTLIVEAAGNSPPQVDAGGPYSGAEGSDIALSPTVSDPDGDALTYKWTVNTTGIDAGGQCAFDDDETKNAKVKCTDDSDDAAGGKFTLTLQVDDGNGHQVSADADLTVSNANPTATAGGPYSGTEGGAIQLGGSGDDPGDNDDGQLTYLWTVTATGIDGGGTCGFDDATKSDATVTCTDDSGLGTFQLTLVVGDDDGGSSTPSYANLTVANAPPVITGVTLAPPSAGNVYPIAGQPIVNATFTDAGSNDTHTCTFDVKDEVLNIIPVQGRSCGLSLNAPAAGLYTVKVTVADDDGDSDEEGLGALIVIYDPSAGFVTGGGWIDSPEGACRYAACQSSTVGKATFGFVSKYISQGKDKTPELTGNTEFQFQAGDLNFKSKSYEWLVVNGGSGRAQYKGEGTVNGTGSYGFILTAYDGPTDKFRIKIWDVSSGNPVYDNKMGEPDSFNDATALGGGSIIIHVPKK